MARSVPGKHVLDCYSRGGIPQLHGTVRNYVPRVAHQHAPLSTRPYLCFTGDARCDRARLRGAAQIDKCFGFDTAVEESQRALLAAKVEAASAFKGVGVVKLMGRQSGFIAMQASMASGARPAGAWCLCRRPPVRSSSVCG